MERSKLIDFALAGLLVVAGITEGCVGTKFERVKEPSHQTLQLYKDQGIRYISPEECHKPNENSNSFLGGSLLPDLFSYFL